MQFFGWCFHLQLAVYEKYEFWMVLEYVPGGSLYSRLHTPSEGPLSHFPLTERLKLSILSGIASGMKFLHSINIIHKDLTLKNVLLDLNHAPKVSLC